MLTIKLESETIEIKSDVKEMNIDVFEKICGIFDNKKYDQIDKYIEIFKVLGLTEDQIGQIDAYYFIDLVKEFNLTKAEQPDFTKEIIIDGFTYQAFEKEKFVLSVRDLAKIENYIKKDNIKYIGEMLAIIYKRTDLTKVEHYTDAHIKFKADLFRKELKADIALPYLVLLSNKIIKSIENGK